MTEQPSTYIPQLWVYQQWEGTDPPPFGDSTTYELGIKWLAETCESIEDWGAAFAYGRRFVPEGVHYRAIDGSPDAAPWCDLIVNLRDYIPHPQPDGILMRHVLEHNLDWEALLEHVMGSFAKRLCLVTFTPFGTTTHSLRPDGDDYRDLSFGWAEFASHISRVGISWTVQALQTNTQYGTEHICYIERVEARPPAERDIG